MRLPRLDRITRFFGWRLLYGALRCSATAVQEKKKVRRLCCGASARWARCRSCGLRCAAQPRPAQGMTRWWGHRWSPCRTSLCIALWCSRLLLGCAASGRALLVAGRVPPLDVRVLLAGDHTVWDPRGGGEAGAELWTHLRLLFCRAVWYLRCCRVSGPWPSVLCFCCGGSDFFLA